MSSKEQKRTLQALNNVQSQLVHHMFMVQEKKLLSAIHLTATVVADNKGF